MSNILHSKKAAARLLSVGVRTVENLISNQQLPVRRIGRRALIPHQALMDFAKTDHPTNNPKRSGAVKGAADE